MKFKNIKKKARKAKSPSNSRTIPDSAKATSGKPALFHFSLPKVNHTLLIKTYHQSLKVFVTFIFIVAVIIVGIDFKNNLQVNKEINSQRQVLAKNLNFWENFISKQQNYPDAYFQISMLEYQLGETSKAKTDVEKGLVLDPNSQAGKKIEDFFLNK